MLIVLEGCDGVGKTTIANQLKSILDAEIVHCTRETTNDFDFFSGLIDASKYRNIIADRFCYGQFVYQKPNERALTKQDLEKLETHMLSVGAKVIHVTASVEEIKNRLKLRGDTDWLHADEICSKYLELFETTLIHPEVWWTGGHD